MTIKLPLQRYCVTAAALRREEEGCYPNSRIMVFSGCVEELEAAYAELERRNKELEAELDGLRKKERELAAAAARIA